MLRPEDIRTVATIQDGIKIDCNLKNRRSIDYQPGNGSCYELVFTSLDGLAVPGCDDDFILVSLKKTPNTWAAYPFRKFASPDHIAKKLDVGFVDALVLCEIINYVLKNELLSLERLVEIGNEILQVT